LDVEMPLPPTFASVPTLDAFFGEPAKRIVLHRSFAYWQVERRAFGTIIWGRPNEADVIQMCAAHEVGANPLFSGHTSLVDIRGLESVDVLAFQRLLGYLIERREAWSPTVSRQAVLYQGGYAHAVVLGMFKLLRPGHPVVFFDDPVAAFDAVGAADAREELEALRSSFIGTPEIVRRVQQAFEQLGPRADFTEVARHVSMSVRSLQRKLAGSGTTLSNEHQQHVLRTSERLLELTDLDLEAIAAQTGASSASHLVTLFRKHHGTTPGGFRAARRASSETS
jgi:AraC-like DNA-binding protein